MLELRLVLWKATIQCAQTVPHVTVGHAHTVHKSKALLAGRQCGTVYRCGTVVDYLEPGLIGIHSLTISPAEGPELQH